MICSKSTKTHGLNLLMFYSESEAELSNFAINSLSNFDPTFSDSKSESDESESDFNSVFMNLGICVFFYPIFTLF